MAIETNFPYPTSSFHPVHLGRAGWPSAAGLAAFTAATAGAAAIGSKASREHRGVWYSLLRKSALEPPPQAYAGIWTVLYGAIAFSGWRIWKQPSSSRRSVALGLWGAQLVLNAAWPWWFFGGRRPRAALADVGVLIAAVAACRAVAKPVDRGASRLFTPYLAWLGVAAYLNTQIVRLNRLPRG